MVRITNEFDSENMDGMNDIVMMIKILAKTLGASRLYYVCQFMEDHYINNNHKELLNLYPSLVEAVIEFKIHLL